MLSAAALHSGYTVSELRGLERLQTGITERDQSGVRLRRDLVDFSGNRGRPIDSHANVSLNSKGLPAPMASSVCNIRAGCIDISSDFWGEMS